MYQFTLNVKMSWSKNIMEERDSPIQILHPSMDEILCVILNLGIYLEICSEDFYEDSSQFLYGNGKDGDRNVRDSIAKIIGIYYKNYKIYF